MIEQQQYYEEYNLGDERLTIARTISEADITFHAGHSGDYFPHHIDAEYCKTQPFKKPIAHGTMTFAIGIGLTATIINPKAMSYGYDRLRFPNPVFAGDTIRTKVTIKEKLDDPKRPNEYGRVVEATEVTNQNGDTVLYTEHILIVEKKK